MVITQKYRFEERIVIGRWYVRGAVPASRRMPNVNGNPKAQCRSYGCLSLELWALAGPSPRSPACPRLRSATLQGSCTRLKPRTTCIGNQGRLSRPVGAVMTWGRRGTPGSGLHPGGWASVLRLSVYRIACVISAITLSKSFSQVLPSS